MNLLESWNLKTGRTGDPIPNPATNRVIDPSFVGGSNDSYLEDHPRTCKWLITMGMFRPLTGVIPLPNGLNGLNMGVTKYLLTGTILQIGYQNLTSYHFRHIFVVGLRWRQMAPHLFVGKTAMVGIGF